MSSCAVAGVWLVCSLWHILPILQIITLIYKHEYLRLIAGRFVVYKSYPHTARLYPHINRGDGDLWINHTPNPHLLVVDFTACGKLASDV